MAKSQKPSDTAIWYFIASAFVSGVGSVILGGGEPGSSAAKWSAIVGLILMACGVVVFVKERRQRRQPRRAARDVGESSA